MEHTRYANEEDFRGLLRYGLSGIEEQELIGKVLTPELWDLSAITHRTSTLRQLYDWTEHAGVPCVPTEREHSFRDLLKQIDTSVNYLQSIVSEMLSLGERREHEKSLRP